MGRERFLVYVSLIQILSVASISMSNAQDKSNFITLQLKKVSFEELKTEIESQCEYSFFLYSKCDWRCYAFFFKRS